MEKNRGGMNHPPGKIFHAKRRRRDEQRWDVKITRGDAPSPRQDLSPEPKEGQKARRGWKKTVEG
jgi:hypothetical protein